MKHDYSLAHLTVLSLTPPQVVDVAARCGYRYVGLRLTRVTPEDPSVYDDGELKIDEKSYRVFRHGTEVKLAKKEFELLWLLVRNRSSVVSRERILSEIRAHAKHAARA